MLSAQEQATKVLSSVPSYVWDGERLPVPVEDIVDSCFGLHVREVDDLTTAPGAAHLRGGPPLSGLLLPGRGEIWVSKVEAGLWPPRRRFTIGHELGHWVMHRDGQQTLFCRTTTVLSGDDPAEAVAPAVPDIEEEASVFSAAMLMPAHLIESEWARLRDVVKMCEAFDTSNKAMARRLADLAVA